MMKFEYAMHIAKRIMRNNPSYVLCGSVALIAAKVIPEREVHDLDFCCLKGAFEPEGKQMYGDYPPQENEGYLCYKISGDRGYYYNVFVHDSDFILKTRTVGGVAIQDPNQIVKYKKFYNRPKDREDISKMKFKKKTTK